jgi:hypothetical protein
VARSVRLPWRVVPGREVSPTMKDTDSNAKPNHGRILRAADVIPPFSDDGPSPGRPDDSGKPPASAPARAAKPGNGKAGRSLQGVTADNGGAEGDERPIDPSDIPTYNLAENILAEHRQLAAKRRKAPGRPQTAAKAHAAGPPSLDLVDMHHIVAEIVARDIECLCKEPDEPHSRQ